MLCYSKLHYCVFYKLWGKLLQSIELFHAVLVQVECVYSCCWSPGDSGCWETFPTGACAFERAVLQPGPTSLPDPTQGAHAVPRSAQNAMGVFPELLGSKPNDPKLCYGWRLYRTVLCTHALSQPKDKGTQKLRKVLHSGTLAVAASWGSMIWQRLGMKCWAAGGWEVCICDYVCFYLFLFKKAFTPRISVRHRKKAFDPVNNRSDLEFLRNLELH